MLTNLEIALVSRIEKIPDFFLINFGIGHLERIDVSIKLRVSEPNVYLDIE